MLILSDGCNSQSLKSPGAVESALLNSIFFSGGGGGEEIVFYTRVTKKFVTSLPLHNYDVIACILADT